MTLDDAPDKGLWFSCEHPERTTDRFVGWHLSCAGCAIAAEARALREPQRDIAQFTADLLREGQ